MLRDRKNLKDPKQSRQGGTYGADSQNMSVIGYNKTNKLITALYMVTDIIDPSEPLKNKLRTLGVGIISDINCLSIRQADAAHKACDKISEILSFLDIAAAMNIISLMNCNILRKEFYELDQSIRQSYDKAHIFNKQIDLSEFLSGELEAPQETSQDFRSTRLGVQKGSTLLKSINKMSDRIPVSHGTESAGLNPQDFLNTSVVSKRQRREDIVNIIKIMGGSANIKDIKDKSASTLDKGHSLNFCSEKTLQRELISMAKDGVLKKSGEKRWSRYSLTGADSQ